MCHTQYKKCNECGEEKSLDNFNKDRTIKGGRRGRCRDCTTAYNADYYNKRYRGNPEALREAWLWRSYKITPAEYAELLKDQYGCCAICQVDFHMEDHRHANAPVVDHCHEGGHVRGLLCQRCNRGIGYFKDEPNILWAAVRYLVNDRAEVIRVED